MVMENEIRLGDIMDKLTPSDRVVIYNAARQVVYRGYAANAVHGTLNPQRRMTRLFFLRRSSVHCSCQTRIISVSLSKKIVPLIYIYPF